jgi:predicted O-methyltransferase YrrM
MPAFTHDWTQGFDASMRSLFPTPPTEATRCMEIGCFEGCGSLKIAAELCALDGSKLLCVDPWDDAYVRDSPSEWDPLFVGQYARFKANTEHNPRIVPMRGRLRDFAAELATAGEPFDFIYVDGDHSEEGAYSDACLAWSLLKPGGVLLFDDYKPHWGVYAAVNRFKDEVNAAAKLAVGMNGQFAFVKKEEE